MISTSTSTQLRDDVQFFPVPFQKLVEKAYPPGQDRQVVSRQAPQSRSTWSTWGWWRAACGIEMEAVEAGIRREFPGRKAKAAEININAARTGFEWAEREPAGRPAVPGPSGWSRPARRS